MKKIKRALSLGVISIIFSSYISAQTSNINMELIEASIAGNFQNVRSLIADGANVNSLLVIDDGTQRTALMAASDGGFFDIAVYLISKGALINTRTKGGTTALMFASRNGNIDLVTLLSHCFNSIDILELRKSPA